MNIREIVKAWLLENHYDGLYNADGCGCSADDLMTCEELNDDCIPGVHRLDLRQEGSDRWIGPKKDPE